MGDKGMIRWLTIGMSIGLVIASVPARAGGAGGSLESSVGMLLDGVAGIPKFGVPGAVAIFGEGAFPVIAGGEAGKPRMALVAAAEAGRGRIVIFGHTGYLDGEVADAGHRRLLGNAVAWCAGNRTARVGVRACRMEGFLSSEGWQARRVVGALAPDVFRGMDVLVLNAQGLTDPGEADAVGAFVRGGGGLIAAATGWAFEQTSGGKELRGGLAINRVLAPAGLAFTPLVLDHAGDRFAAGPSPMRMLNAHDALRSLGMAGGSDIGDEDFRQAGSAIEVALAGQPPGRSAFLDAVAAAVGGMRADIPSEKRPLRAGTSRSGRVRLALEARLAQSADADAVRPHPAATVFPGAVPASAAKTTREVEIDPQVPGWHSTGLYAGPGNKVVVTVPAAAVSAGLSVRIGCHTDRLYALDAWCRAPEISRKVPIGGAVTAAANAFGGLVYIEAPDTVQGKVGRFSAKIEGAVPAPLFVLGRDTDAAWNATIKRREGPWAEFACERVILTCPSEIARRVSNPTELMTFWTKVLDAQAELAGIPAERRRPERIVADAQISAGYMHSGYPIMVLLVEAGRMVTRSRGEAPGWGFYHELGHNHQRPEWTFDGTGEVTCNLFSLWSIHRALGEADPTVGHEAMSEEVRSRRMKKHLAAGAPFEGWKRDPFLALTLYWQLIDAFGWESLKKVIASYGGGEFGPPPKSDAEKRDQWMVRYSKVSGRNLGPFFERWGVPVSAGAKAGVAALEGWMPGGM